MRRCVGIWTHSSTVMITLNELKEKLKSLDEVLLLELLEISAEDLIENFSDRIEDKLETLMEYYE